MERNTLEYGNNGKRGLFISSVYGALIGCGVGAVTLLILCFVALATDNPGALCMFFALASLALTGFSSGLAAFRFYKSAPLAVGLLSGALTVLLVFSFSLLFPGALDFPFALIAYVGILLLSVLGAIVTDSLQKSKDSRPKRSGAIKRFKNMR